MGRSEFDGTDTGALARKAAYECLEARFESPREAANKWGVDRQHVNYYVRKLVAAGVCRSVYTQQTHKHAHFFVVLRSRGLQRSSQRARLGRARLRAVHRRAPSCTKPNLCWRRRGCEFVKEGSAGGMPEGLGAVAGLIWLT